MVINAGNPNWNSKNDRLWRLDDVSMLKWRSIFAGNTLCLEEMSCGVKRAARGHVLWPLRADKMDVDVKTIHFEYISAATQHSLARSQPLYIEHLLQPST